MLVHSGMLPASSSSSACEYVITASSSRYLCQYRRTHTPQWPESMCDPTITLLGWYILEIVNRSRQILHVRTSMPVRMTKIFELRFSSIIDVLYCNWIKGCVTSHLSPSQEHGGNNTSVPYSWPCLYSDNIRTGWSALTQQMHVQYVGRWCRWWRMRWRKRPVERWNRRNLVSIFGAMEISELGEIGIFDVSRECALWCGILLGLPKCEIQSDKRPDVSAFLLEHVLCMKQECIRSTILTKSNQTSEIFWLLAHLTK